MVCYGENRCAIIGAHDKHHANLTRAAERGIPRSSPVLRCRESELSLVRGCSINIHMFELLLLAHAAIPNS